MKKTLLFAMVLAVAPFAVNAAEDLGMRKGGYGMAGCGLGSMVFEKNSTFSQVLAATTNGTFGSQTFGITSGTSNCTQGGVAKADKEQELFVSMNFERLTEEMAQGKGETLDSFASLIGCSSSAEFAKHSQESYASTYSKAGTPTELLSSVKAQIAARPEVCTSTI